MRPLDGTPYFFTMGKRVDVPSPAGRRSAVRLVCATATLVTAVAVGACDSPVASAQLDFSATERVPVTEIQIAGGSGDVTVRGDGAQGEVQIKRTVRYQGGEPDATYQISGTVLRVDTDCGESCTVSYQIQVPPGVAVRGSNGSGDLDLAQVAGIDVWVGSGSITVTGSSADVSVQTGTGDITVDSVRGALTAKAGSGSVRASEVRQGPTEVQVGSGDATVALASPGDVRVRTSSGDLEVAVPNAAYQVRTSTGAGDEDIDVDHDPTGEYVLEVTSGSGDITVATT